MSEWNPQRFIRWAGEIGANTQLLITSVLRSREVPEQAYRSCMGLLNLAKQTGNDRLEAACSRANRFGINTYRGVKRILDKRLDSEPLPATIASPIRAHENIRGGEYYRLDGSRS